MADLLNILKNDQKGLFTALCVMFLACMVSAIMTPICKKIALKTGFLDVPASEGHKLHKKATPLLGGFAILCGVLVPVLSGCFWIAQSHFSSDDILGGIHNISKELSVILLCTTAFAILGAIDDKFALKAWKKFLVQILIITIAVIWGDIRISLFIESPAITIPLTMFWFLFIMNGFNFFDNMDGLAVGTAAIAFLFFTITSFIQGQFLVTAFSAACAGASFGFWFYNAAPASIFMGDCGSHLLGFLICIISVKVIYYNPQLASSRFSVLIPIFILAVLIFDTITVVCIRIHNHKPIYIGDHNHISHRFVRMGLTRPDAVRLIHLLELISGLGAIPILWGDIKTCSVLLLQGCILLFLLTLLQFNSNRNLPTGETHHE